ncbi:transcriptional repressor [Methylosoma difficile]
MHPQTHDHQHCIDHALITASHLCTKRGVQLTPIRQQVLALIWENHKAVKAYDLLDRIKPLNTAAKPATIYRALDFLIAQGLIHRVESLNAFIGCRCSGQSHEQLLLICKQCHQVEERTPEIMLQALSAELISAHFTAHSKAIEIQGICGNCAQSNEPIQTDEH